MPTNRRAAPEFIYDVRARLAPAHYALLQMVAEQADVGISAALRLVLDDVLSGGRIAQTEGIELLKLAEGAIEADPGWLERHGTQDAG